MIVEFVGLFPDENSAPSVQVIQDTVQETSVLDNGVDNLEVDTQYVTDIRKCCSLFYFQRQGHDVKGSCDSIELFRN